MVTQRLFPTACGIEGTDMSCMLINAIFHTLFRDQISSELSSQNVSQSNASIIWIMHLYAVGWSHASHLLWLCSGCSQASLMGQLHVVHSHLRGKATELFGAGHWLSHLSQRGHNSSAWTCSRLRSCCCYFRLEIYWEETARGHSPFPVQWWRWLSRTSPWWSGSPQKSPPVQGVFLRPPGNGNQTHIIHVCFHYYGDETYFHHYKKIFRLV